MHLLSGEAQALITGGEGNKPLDDPGWPKGAAEVFNAKSRIANAKSRIAWWEGPPFGGGEWHAEYRGDAATFNEVLRAFAKIESPKRRLVVHDGVGRSFWLNMNNEESKRAAAEADWTFVVWQPDRWKHLQQLPADLRPRGGASRDAAAKDEVPTPRMDVYVGGRVQWTDVTVPDGIEVEDRRLEAHGFKIADGRVLEGTVTDLESGKPIAATVRLEKVESLPKGGYEHHPGMTAQAAASDGRWVLKSVPTGWHRIVVDADGYVLRIVGYEIFDDQPRWSEHHTGLSKAAAVSGVVTDDAGHALAGAVVRLGDLVAGDGERYETPAGFSVETDAAGRFRAAAVPKGRASVWVNKPGYVRPGLGLPIETPTADLKLEMQKAAAIVVTVDFVDADRPAGYIVQLVPEGGEAVGKWSGSGNIDAAGKITFTSIPPGKYVLTGRPNPGSDAEEAPSKTLELRGGETAEVSLDPR
ncbi:MAG: carboxypeptidase-like regulatory domain-containing protein [Planctomycetota bacterium]|nr:carboxypeptidase regulatory-like domain-containing protein [Planctomycetaceae bacterium]MDQ3331227.1 carboxypeptidase-like regulatory domain-containing protein [Planctomycetota bacterium]